MCVCNSFRSKFLTNLTKWKKWQCFAFKIHRFLCDTRVRLSCTFNTIESSNDKTTNKNWKYIHSFIRFRIKFQLISNLFIFCTELNTNQCSFLFFFWILFESFVQRLNNNGNSTSNKKCNYPKGIGNNYLRISK